MPRAIDRRVAILFASLSLCLPAAGRLASQPSITWTAVVNATIDGSVLQKTAGLDGVDDAGAASVETLTGDGYVEFTVGEAGTLWFAGLSHDNQSTSWTEIDFSFRFNGAGWADVIENGVYAGGDTPYSPGDRFRISVVNGRVQYHRNGIFLQESGTIPTTPLALDTSLLTIGATVREAVMAAAPPPPPGGGFIETSGSPALRPRFTRAQIEAFLPAGGATGAFRFPAPYNTTAVRLTNASTCQGGQDCLWYVGYSYWRNINSHVGDRDMYIFLGTDPQRGGVGPILLRYDKRTDGVTNLGPLFADGPYRFATGEGWYFSAGLRTRLYVWLVGSPQLWRYDILKRRFESGPAMDLTDCLRPGVCPPEASFITQPHSSDDDRIYSATVQDSNFQRLGCVVYDAGKRRFRFFGVPADQILDECHVDKSGRWLMILETRVDGSRRNRIVELGSGVTTILNAVEGALGHLDMGFGYAVGADTFNPLPNATILLKFPVTSTTRPLGPVVHFNKRWDIAASNHIAHGNGANLAPERQYACCSNASRVADMGDEIVCFSLDSGDGSLDTLVVGQALADLDAPGGSDFDGDDYEQTPKGNLDVSGRYFVWTTNFGGDRLDAVVVKIPAERLTTQPAATR